MASTGGRLPDFIFVPQKGTGPATGIPLAGLLITSFPKRSDGKPTRKQMRAIQGVASNLFARADEMPDDVAVFVEIWERDHRPPDALDLSGEIPDELLDIVLEHAASHVVVGLRWGRRGIHVKMAHDLGLVWPRETKPH